MTKEHKKHSKFWILWVVIGVVVILTIIILKNNIFSQNTSFANSKFSEISETAPFEVNEMNWKDCQYNSQGSLLCGLNVKLRILQAQKYSYPLYVFYINQPYDYSHFINVSNYRYIPADSMGEQLMEFYDIIGYQSIDESNIYFCWVSSNFFPGTSQGKFKCISKIITNPKYDMEFSPSTNSVTVKQYDSTTFTLRLTNKGNLKISPFFVSEVQDWDPSFSFTASSSQEIKPGESVDYIATVYGRRSSAYNSNYYIQIYPTYYSYLARNYTYSRKDYIIQVTTIPLQQA